MTKIDRIAVKTLDNIKWDVDMDEILEVIGKMTAEKAAEVLGIPKSIYANMNDSERNDYAYDVFHRNSQAKADLIGLPTEVEIPYGTEEIADYLSDKYEYCVRSFDIRPEKEHLYRRRSISK